MRNSNSIVLNAVDTASQNGTQLDTRNLINASFQAVFGDSTANGTFKLQMSNDVAPEQISSSPIQTFTVTNWTDIPNASASITSGGSAVLQLTNVSCRWIRAVYVRSSGGSTTVKVQFFGIYA